MHNTFSFWYNTSNGDLFLVEKSDIFNEDMVREQKMYLLLKAFFSSVKAWYCGDAVLTFITSSSFELSHSIENHGSLYM